MLQHFYHQVDALNGDWSPEKNIRKATEELGEVSAAFLRIEGLKEANGRTPGELWDDLHGEIGDFFVCGFALAASSGMTPERLAEKIQAGIDKWAAKVAANNAQRK